MFEALRSARWLFALALLGCGDAQLSNSEAGLARSADAGADCQPLAEGEALIGVSPEGDAWVEGDDGLRLVLPNGTSTLVDAGFTRADAMVAWDRTSAFAVGDNSLWATTVAGSSALSLPPELGKPRFVCGDPGRASGAFLVTTRGLFERHNETWFRWSFPVELLESMKIRDLQGACSGQEPLMYLEAGQSLWEVRHGEQASLREAADLSEMSAVGPDVRVGFVALRDGEPFRFDGAGWVRIPFDEGRVTAMSVADGVLWAAVDGALYRRNRYDEWEYLEAPMWPTFIDEIRSYAAGGAWVVRTGQLCHVQAHAALRVSGVRPYGRLAEDSVLAARVSGEPATDSALSARLDGQGLQVEGSEGAWTLTGSGALSPGWHTLTLSVASSSGAAQRTVKFFVEGGEEGTPPPPPGEPTVSWEDDIRPLYERSCAACHGEGLNQTFMGSFEAFSALGELALDRVSRGEMPPAAASSAAPPFSDAEVELLRTWVQEGMNP